MIASFKVHANKTPARYAGRFAVALLLCGQLSLSHAQQAVSGTGCDSYDLDVKNEIELLASPPSTIVAAAASNAPVPSLQTRKHYQLRLAPQADVRFVAPPERRMLDEGAFAGLAVFTVESAGTWRIGLGHNSWVDIVAPDGSLVKSTRFGGRAGCAGLRKMVEFPLQAGIEYTLQLSGGTEQSMAVVISGPITSAP